MLPPSGRVSSWRTLDLVSDVCTSSPWQMAIPPVSQRVDSPSCLTAGAGRKSSGKAPHLLIGSPSAVPASPSIPPFPPFRRHSPRILRRALPDRDLGREKLGVGAAMDGRRRRSRRVTSVDGGADSSGASRWWLFAGKRL